MIKDLTYPSFGHSTDFEPVPYLGSCTKNRVRGKLENTLRLQAYTGHAKRPEVLFHVDHDFFTVQENQINREQHADRVHAM